MSSPVRSWWSIVSCALRGAIIGVVVWGIFALSLAYAERVIAEEAERLTSDRNGVEILGAMILFGLEVAVPASLVAGFVLAWTLRLRRPWLVAPLGLLFSCLLTWAVPAMPGWGSAAILALSFAAAALTPLAFRRPGQASPAGASETPTPAGPGGQA